MNEAAHLQPAMVVMMMRMMMTMVMWVVSCADAVKGGNGEQARPTRGTESILAFGAGRRSLGRAGCSLRVCAQSQIHGRQLAEFGIH